MMMLGEKIGAEQAEEWGLIYKCVADELLMDEARALGEKLANGPTLALKHMKKNIVTAMDGPVDSVLRVEAEAQYIASVSQDAKSGKAFLEKRKAVFKGA